MMNLMICLRGEPEQLPFLPEIAKLGAGIELSSYGLIGIQSERDWETRFAMHKAICNQFQGPIAIHGPFIGMEYAYIDHLIREVVNRRLDMTFDVAVKLSAHRVVLHSGYTPTIDLFKLQDAWLKRCVAFWMLEDLCLIFCFTLKICISNTRRYYELENTINENIFTLYEPDNDGLRSITPTKTHR